MVANVVINYLHLCFIKGKVLQNSPLLVSRNSQDLVAARNYPQYIPPAVHVADELIANQVEVVSSKNTSHLTIPDQDVGVLSIALLVST